ncbi:unnamed protein product [Closterium sp. NIES-64]|nr:unnamed protein product [Closterium sp. NIES-65]CAI5976495.1 unnamed protein product [Closterium sp. NIES-64]
MPPKGSRKAVVDPLVADTNTLTDPALSTTGGKNEESVITAAQVVDNAAGSSGLSVEEKCDTIVDLDDAVEELVDDSDDELDVDFKADELSASLRVNPLILPIVLDPAVALISTGNLRGEWLCTQTGYRKAHGTSLMDVAAHIKLANHLQHLETLGTPTKPTLEKASLSAIKKDYEI